MPLDPNNANGLKVSNKYKKLIHTDAESVLEFIDEYDEIVEDLNIPEGVARFRLLEALIHSNAAKSAWGNIRDLHTENDQPTLELCINLWTLKFMTRDISLGTKEYLRIVKKPRQWTVAKLNDRLQTLNNVIAWMPATLLRRPNKVPCRDWFFHQPLRPLCRQQNGQREATHGCMACG